MNGTYRKIGRIWTGIKVLSQIELIDNNSEYRLADMYTDKIDINWLDLKNGNSKVYTGKQSCLSS